MANRRLDNPPFAKTTTGTTFALVVVTLLAGSCLGFSTKHPLLVAVRDGGHHRHRRDRPPKARHGCVRPNFARRERILRMSGGESSLSAPFRKKDSGGDGIVPAVLFKCNASTKWVLTFLNSLALWTRPRRYEGPFIVFGSIAAVYLTNFLKRTINQGRPAGAPFTDPGMPSSHALLSFFIATSWDSTGLLYVGSPGPLRASIWLGAATVAWLRVACGYHTWVQVSVGAGLGGLLGQLWVAFGRIISGEFPAATFHVAWVLYLTGAAYFITTKMKGWVTSEKHL